MIDMRITLTGNGLNMPKEVQSKIEKMKKEILQEFGMKAKEYARENIQKANAVATGQLLSSLHYRTTANSSEVWTDSPIALMWELGVKKKHWINRNMVSYEGYSVGDWMDAKGIKGNWIKVPRSGSHLNKGIFFMSNAYLRLLREAPMILNKYARMI